MVQVDGPTVVLDTAALDTAELSAVPSAELLRVVANLRDPPAQITDALDTLFGSFR